MSDERPPAPLSNDVDPIVTPLTLLCPAGQRRVSGKQADAPRSSIGRADVYEAVAPNGEPMVVKRLDTATATADPLAARRFAREMHLASVLAHPSLPAVLARDGDWIGFEQLDASLADPETARRWSSPESVRRLLLMLADVLAYLHALGIVHGDIKPANTMFRAGQPVLIDFGIASIGADEPEFAAELAGSPAWMAPEQVSSPQRIPSSDIWSLAAVMTFLLSGIRPYHGSADDILARRRRGEPPGFRVPAEVRRDDPDLCRLLEQGLGPAEQRPTAAAIVQRLRARL
jgi:serine/threonine-protein kinase PpkA